MTYRKRCRNRGNKVAALTLSMVMLGSASSPAVKVLGEEYGRIYAENLVKDDLLTNLKIACSDYGDTVYFYYTEYNMSVDTKKSKYNEIKEVVINGQKFDFKEFNGYNENGIGDYVSLPDRGKAHKDAWKSVGDGEVIVSFIKNDGVAHNWSSTRGILKMTNRGEELPTVGNDINKSEPIVADSKIGRASCRER